MASQEPNARKRSLVWTYFTATSSHFVPVCDLCGETVKTSNNTTNLFLGMYTYKLTYKKTP